MKHTYVIEYTGDPPSDTRFEHQTRCVIHNRYVGDMVTQLEQFAYQRMVTVRELRQQIAVLEKSEESYRKLLSEKELK